MLSLIILAIHVMVGLKRGKCWKARGLQGWFELCARQKSSKHNQQHKLIQLRYIAQLYLRSRWIFSQGEGNDENFACKNPVKVATCKRVAESCNILKRWMCSLKLTSHSNTTKYHLKAICIFIHPPMLLPLPSPCKKSSPRGFWLLIDFFAKQTF